MLHVYTACLYTAYLSYVCTLALHRSSTARVYYINIRYVFVVLLDVCSMRNVCTPVVHSFILKAGRIIPFTVNNAHCGVTGPKQPRGTEAVLRGRVIIKIIKKSYWLSEDVIS